MLLRALIFAFVTLLLAPQDGAAQILRLPHPDSTIGNFFGVSVSLDGNRALVGASSEDACGENSGAAYVFERSDSSEVWHQVARLTANDCEAGDFFGRSLSLSDDRAIVAAAQTFFNAAASNAAYVFERDPETGVWQQTARLTADIDRQEGAFATSVNLQGDRTLITTSGDPANAAYGGAAYIFDFDRRTKTWTRSARLSPSNDLRHAVFGGSGALDGDRIAVAASTYFREAPGAVYIFDRDDDGTWRESARIDGISDFFISVDLEDDLLLVGESKGARKAGAATLYERTAGGWQRLQRLRPRAPYEFGAFGSAVSLAGDLALVVGYDEQLGHSFNVDRVVYVFQRDPDDGRWKQARVMDIGQVEFGAAVATDGTHAVIGAASESVAGSAYIARLPTSF